ncbi:uncharacterized protein LOC133834045 [Humulus lupulus]|uniref:uncharacterized protein LOC133834045 n=1 Tax=Humulus lupulus TaxID=3486 RepID=UPI002B402309|nr:uncharacterized protein LOC133834045 [Humulus lupulus]
MTEIYILKKLEWRMRPITAFCFLGYLEPMFMDYPITRFNRRTINKIIIQSQSEPLFTYLKPSLIATIALLVASLCLCPAKYSSFCHKLVSGNVIAQRQAVIYLPCMVNLCKDLQLSGLSSGISLNDQLLISTAHATFSNFHQLINNKEFLCFVYKMLIDHLIFVSKYKEIVANGINNGESSSSSSSSMGLKICKDIQFDFPLRWKLSGLLKDDDDEAIFGFHGLLLRLPLVKGLRFFSSPLMHFLNKMNICLQTIPDLSSAPYQHRKKLQQALGGFTNYRMKMEDEAIRLVNLMKLRGSTIS